MEEAPVQLRDVAISDSGFVFDPCTGHTFTVNATGLVILRAIKEGLHQGAIASRMRERFAIEPEDDPLRDVQDFITQLREVGLAR